MTHPLDQWRESAPHWVKHSATIEQMFAPVTRALIDAGGIVAGQSVLDVAGGAGEPSLTIAGVVGPNGSVMCTDAIAEMVEGARAEAVRRGLSNVQFRRCSADSLPFPDNSFDVAVSRLGAMFFTDPGASMREMLRALKPGGGLAFAVWHKSELNPFSYVITQIMSRHVQTAPEDPDAPGAFRFAEPGKLAGILKDAGVIAVAEHVFKFYIAAPVSVDEFWAMRSSTSESLRAKLEILSTEHRSQIAVEVREAVKEFFPENKMRFPAQMLIVKGQKSH